MNNSIILGNIFWVIALDSVFGLGAINFVATLLIFIMNNVYFSLTEKDQSVCYYFYIPGLYIGHVFPAILARPEIVICQPARAWEVSGWRWIHSVDLGSRYFFRQWKDCLLPQGHNGKSVPTHFTHWRNFA